MIAPAVHSALRPHGRLASSIGLFGLRAAVATACFCAAAPAFAEVGAAVSVFSDSRFRGYSLSGGHPVAIFDLSYDDSGGAYATASASALASQDDGIKPLGLQLNGGYAKRLSSGITLDVGATHSIYSQYSSRGSANSYTEIYAGAAYKFLSSRVAFSPHYYERGARTLYGEINANIGLARKVSLTGHFGLLAPVRYRDKSDNPGAQYDWRLGISRELGRASLQLIATGGGPERDYYRGLYHSRNALIFGAAWAL